jgi:group I intron endonuclease
MDNAGIYKITCKVNNVTYIGSTKTSFKKRWKKHKQRLNNNYHENSYLQNSWNKHGKDNFIFEILEKVDNIDKINERESYWISLYFPRGRRYCFNLSDHVCGGNTVKDVETKIKLSQSVKNSYTPELRKIRSEHGKHRREELIIRLKETVSTEKWKIANAEKNKRLAKDPNWLQRMKDVNKHRQIKVSTNRGEIFLRQLR